MKMKKKIMAIWMVFLFVAIPFSFAEAGETQAIQENNETISIELATLNDDNILSIEAITISEEELIELENTISILMDKIESASSWEEIENIISEHRIKYIEFVDDTFTYDYEFVVTLCELLLEKKLSIKWGCQTRADFLNAELLALMRKSGCVKISLGLETAVDKIRAIIGKHIKLETYRNIFKLLKINNIYSMALIMLGLPTERQCDMLKSLKAAKKLADMAIFQLNHVYPGTTHFHELKEKGKITENIWDDYMNYHADYPYYIPEDLSLKQLNLFLKRSYIEFYFRPTYFLKWINKIQSLNQLNNFIKVAKRIFTFKVRFKKQL